MDVATVRIPSLRGLWMSDEITLASIVVYAGDDVYSQTRAVSQPVQSGQEFLFICDAAGGHRGVETKNLRDTPVLAGSGDPFKETAYPFR